MVHPQGNANVYRALRACCRREIAENTLPGVRQGPLLACRRGRARGGCRGARAVGRPGLWVRWARLLIHLLPARRFRPTPFLPLDQVRLRRLSFVIGDRANCLPAEIQAGSLGDECAQVGRLGGVALQGIIEHARQGFDTRPQVLRNVRLADKAIANHMLQTEPVTAAVAGWRDRLGSSGRILLRKSGTEPLIRVMVEAEDEHLVETIVFDLCCILKGATPLPIAA